MSIICVASKCQYLLVVSGPDVDMANEIAIVRQQLEALERQLKEGKQGIPLPAVASLRAATQENQTDVEMAFDAPQIQTTSGLFLGPTTDAFAVNQVCRVSSTRP